MEPSINQWIAIGAAGGASASLIFWIVQNLTGKIKEYYQRNRVCKWINETTVQNEKGIAYKTTKEISSANNITQDRARYLCSIDNRIHLSVDENINERWCLKAYKPVDDIPTPIMQTGHGMM